MNLYDTPSFYSQILYKNEKVCYNINRIQNKTKNQIMNIQQIKTEKIRWINIINPGQKEIDYLREKFHFHPLDLKDCLTQSQRSKVDIYPDYIFLVLLFPIYNKETQEISASEVDFFISKDYLISLHKNDLKPLKGFFNICNLNNKIQDKYFTEPEALLYEIINKLLLQCFPMIEHVGLDINDIEKKIFRGYEKKMVEEILIIRRNITDFRKITQAHKNTLKKLIGGLQASDLFIIQKTDIYYNNLIDCTKEIWDALESFKESIEALQQTNESLISFRLNDVMKLLTILSVTMLPVTLIASIFGMNTKAMPLADNPLGFWFVLGISMAVVLTMIFYFKSKKWF